VAPGVEPGLGGSDAPLGRDDERDHENGGDRDADEERQARPPHERNNHRQQRRRLDYDHPEEQPATEHHQSFVRR
jgi:hypothetical protein